MAGKFRKLKTSVTEFGVMSERLRDFVVKNEIIGVSVVKECSGARLPCMPGACSGELGYYTNSAVAKATAWM